MTLKKFVREAVARAFPEPTTDYKPCRNSPPGLRLRCSLRSGHDGLHAGHVNRYEVAAVWNDAGEVLEL